MSEMVDNFQLGLVNDDSWFIVFFMGGVDDKSRFV